MAEWLIVRMPRAADAAAEWLPVDEGGRPLAEVQLGSLAAAAAVGGGRQVAVLAPAAEVLCVEAQLPVRGSARAAPLVRYALEEQLAADVDAQHFAIGSVGADGRTDVAVVARAVLEGWLAALDAAGLRAQLLCSEAALLPRVAGHCVALLDDDSLMYAAGERAPPLALAAPPGGLAVALAIAAASAGEGGTLLLHATPSEWQRRGGEAEAARAQLANLRVQLLGSGSLPWLAAQLPVGRPINLLQGAYAPRSPLGAGWARWRTAALLAAALLLVHAGAQLYSLWHLRRAERELDAATATLLGPQLRDGGGPLRTRIESRLSEARTPGGRSGLLPALQVLAQAVSAAPGARVQSLDFRDGTLQLKLRASDAQSLDRINQSLRAAGWQADLVSGAAAGDAFEGNIQLRRSAS